MAADLIQECQNFEQKINDLGGMEIIVGGYWRRWASRI